MAQPPGLRLLCFGTESMGRKGSEHRGKFATYKQRGEWVELLFMTHAAERGFNVAKPWGDSARYDVSIEHNGRFLRVQVKCTDRWNGSAYSCLLRAAHQHAYSTAQIDYFAIYIVTDDIWYFFPAKKLIGKTVVVLAPHKKNHKHESHREAWDLLQSRSQPRSERPQPVARPIQTHVRTNQPRTKKRVPTEHAPKSQLMEKPATPPTTPAPKRRQPRCPERDI